MDRLFALDMPFTRFARNTLVISVLGIAPLLYVYIALTPGFATMLLAGGPALGRFVRQVVTNGLPVVFAINYLSFFLYALARSREKAQATPRAFLVFDPLARVAVFVALHALIYVLSADWFDSFGGDRLTALRVVGPTLARSALFENISGVYLYATLASALPLYATLFGRLLRRPALSVAPVLLAICLFAGFALILTLAAAAIVRLLS